MKISSLVILFCFSGIFVSAQYDPVLFLSSDNSNPLVDDIVEIRLNALNAGSIPTTFEFSLDICTDPTGLEIINTQVSTGFTVSQNNVNCGLSQQSVQVTGSTPGLIAHEGLVIIQYRVLKPGEFNININNTSVTGANTTTTPGTTLKVLPSFTCLPALYQVIDSQVKVFDPTTQSYTDLGPPFPQFSTINGIGYNSQDDFIYGIGQLVVIGQHRLLRIGSNGDITSIANLTALFPTEFAATSDAKIAGDMDLNGNLYVMNKTATSLCIISNLGANPTLATVPITGPDDISSTADFAFNPVDGFLYGTQSGSGLNVYKLSTSGVQQSIALNPAIACPGTTATGFGASWFDKSGMMYTSCNETGNIYQINVTTGATLRVSTSATQTNNNDGASCALADSPFPKPIPTIGQWGLFILALLISCVGISFMVKKYGITFQLDK